MTIIVTSGNECEIHISAQSSNRLVFDVGFTHEPTQQDIDEADYFIRNNILGGEASPKLAYREDDPGKRAVLARALADGTLERN